MLICNAQGPGGRIDLRICDGRIAEMAPLLAQRPGERVLDAKGGAVLPGLHDHHIHLNAAARALESVVCGPPAVRDAEGLQAALWAAPGEGWIRGVQYHPSVAGEIDRAWLDRHGPKRPIRLQHRSGRLWIFNSLGCGILGDEAPADGRLLDQDALLAARLPAAPPDLGLLGQKLASFGITGVTDATVRNGPEDLARYQRELPYLAVYCMGRPSLAGLAGAGPVKLHYHEDHLPPLEALAAEIAAAHAQGRGIAAHCVTRSELFATLAALEMAGVRQGDRIEHAGIAPPEAVELIARHDLVVVTQPHFIAERGEAYRQDVAAYDLPYLYLLRSWKNAGVALAAGSDAPLGGLNPWQAMAAATVRPAGLGPGEALRPEEALALYLGAPETPGQPRMLGPGAVADLCILQQGWQAALRDLAAVRVAATLRAGKLVFQSG